MIRVFYEVLLFLLPFALYFLYSRVAPRNEAGKLAHETPWPWLFIGGLVLAIAGLVWLGLTEGEHNPGVYVPAHTEGGKVVPGHYENRPTPAP